MSTNKAIGMAINYDYPDYGGMLQAYASFKKIKDLGYKPEAINIDGLAKAIRKRKIVYFAKNIHDISIVKEKSQIILKKIRTKTNRRLGSNLENRRKAFETFCKSHFVCSEEYASWDVLSMGCKKYDSVVVGSDQLWLPSNIAGDYYTLSFVPDETNKVAYATSFGVSDIATGQKEKATEFLSRINYLSARENSGKEIIKKCTGRDVPIVCDPALLLSASEWDKEISLERFIDEDYIFCYFMGNNPWQREYVKQLKKLTGCKIVALLHLDQYIKSDEYYADITPYNVSPADFVNLVKYARYVCTDSFHGTVFSIIYNKTFFTFMRFSQQVTLSTNTRITSLLENLQLAERLVDNNMAVENMLARTMDYEGINTRVEKLREASIEYLLDALGAENG